MKVSTAKICLWVIGVLIFGMIVTAYTLVYFAYPDDFWLAVIFPLAVGAGTAIALLFVHCIERLR